MSFPHTLPLFLLVTMPLSNGLFRWREVLADRYALEPRAAARPLPQ